jgi:hypothetical protein
VVEGRDVSGTDFEELAELVAFHVHPTQVYYWRVNACKSRADFLI